MKYHLHFILCFSLLLLSCSTYKVDEFDPVTVEVVDGFVLVTQKGCFFVPNGYCDCLAYDNSVEKNKKGLIIWSFVNEKELKSFDPIIANIRMMPNTESPNLTVTLDGYFHSDVVKENECYIIPAKVRLISFSRPIEKWYSMKYRFRFKWDNAIYNYVCTDLGTSFKCDIVMPNDSLRHWIFDTQSLPIGRE